MARRQNGVKTKREETRKRRQRERGIARDRVFNLVDRGIFEEEILAWLNRIKESPNINRGKKEEIFLYCIKGCYNFYKFNFAERILDFYSDFIKTNPNIINRLNEMIDDYGDEDAQKEMIRTLQNQELYLQEQHREEVSGFTIR